MLNEDTDSNHVKLYHNENEFERKVMHSQRRYIERAISANEQYNSSGKILIVSYTLLINAIN
jgi:hypothetical protein